MALDAQGIALISAAVVLTQIDNLVLGQRRRRIAEDVAHLLTTHRVPGDGFGPSGPVGYRDADVMRVFRDCGLAARYPELMTRWRFCCFSQWVCFGIAVVLFVRFVSLYG